MFQGQDNWNVMYNMYPFEAHYAPPTNYYQPFQLSFANQMNPSPYNMPNPQMNPSSFNMPNPQMQPYLNPYTPYPKANKKAYMKPQQSQFSGIASQFKTQDGSYDINKVMNTAGQMMNAMNQVTGIVKQVGGFFGR
ncbi:YppG family protein [Microbacteriaceae bacterium 4G12]